MTGERVFCSHLKGKVPTNPNLPTTRACYPVKPTPGLTHPGKRNVALVKGFLIAGVERWDHTFGVGGGVHDERTDWNWGKSRSRRALAGNRCFPGRGRSILRVVVLVAAVLAGLSR